MCVTVHEEADSDRLVSDNERLDHILDQPHHPCDYGVGWSHHVVGNDHFGYSLRGILGVHVPKPESHEVRQKNR